jgi:hypothetical protein
MSDLPDVPTHPELAERLRHFANWRNVGQQLNSLFPAMFIAPTTSMAEGRSPAALTPSSGGRPNIGAMV